MAAGSSARTANPSRHEGLNSDRFLGEVEVIIDVKYEKVFTEGPAVDRAGNLYFTNVPASKNLKWDPKTKELAVYRDKRSETNGLYFWAVARSKCWPTSSTAWRRLLPTICAWTGAGRR